MKRKRQTGEREIVKERVWKNSKSKKKTEDNGADINLETWRTYFMELLKGQRLTNTESNKVKQGSYENEIKIEEVDKKSPEEDEITNEG